MRKNAVILMLVWAFTGCGTIFNGTRQTVSVRSTPEEAGVVVDPGAMKYTTPALVSLERKNEYKITFTKEGYTKEEVEIQRSINGGILVLDILAGLVGVIVDAVTGGWYNLNPKVADVTLKRSVASWPGPDLIRVSVSRSSEGVRVESSEPGVTVEVTRVKAKH